MSAVDTTCYTIPPELESGAGEMKCYKTTLPYDGDSNSMTNIIASEIVNDIIENALDLVMERERKKQQQGLAKFDSISSNVVGDILENILSTSSCNDNNLATQDETALLDDEIKRLIKEMKCPTDQKNIISTTGVGDQLTDKEEIPSEKVLVEPAKRSTLERKNRLTNLVKNSKLMLAKLVSNDSQTNIMIAQNEEKNEKLIRVISLSSKEDSLTCTLREGNRKKSHFPRDSTLDLIELEPLKEENVDERKIDLGASEPSCSKEHIEDKKGIRICKKKWNIGSRIMKVLKRRPKKNQMGTVDDN